MLYKNILKPLMFRLDPEYVHDRMTRNGVMLGDHSVTRAAIEALYGYHGPDLSRTVDGIKYRTPFLLSAGFDYNGQLSRILPHIGLGGEEIGSVTARPCPGNPKPRLTRLPKNRSIIVNKGLRNEGVDKIIARLKSTPRESVAGTGFVTGISIARTNDALSVPIDKGIDDYCYSFERLNRADVGDYYTINISCPNAFGAEAFNDPKLLPQLLGALKAIPTKKPVYVKMPINIPWVQFESLLKTIDRFGLDGVVIGNLNKDYDSLEIREEAPASYQGGLSGKPCAHPSTALIAKTRDLYGKRFTIIGAGGVMSAETALEKFEAGADLVQLITGMIYEGPGLIKKLCTAYAGQSGGTIGA
ncbi:MAG: quinone-dependent dihydroorotate dehydrogenase [Patescibacteria group bacterium]|nr:quinone-dependent dihydroorotate dehydrogenase [Patescibacteria group bacterium]